MSLYGKNIKKVTVFFTISSENFKARLLQLVGLAKR